MFLWEHFGALAPKNVGYSATVPRGTGGVVSLMGVKNVYKDQRWADVKQSNGKSLEGYRKGREFQLQALDIYSYRDLQGPNF